jgi:hypothetical protein
MASVVTTYLVVGSLVGNLTHERHERHEATLARQATTSPGLAVARSSSS